MWYVVVHDLLKMPLYRILCRLWVMQCSHQCLGGQSLNHVHIAHLVYILIYSSWQCMFTCWEIPCVLQKGIAEKLLPQLERLILGKLETTISRQLQTQFQSVGKQALQVLYKTQLMCFEYISQILLLQLHLYGVRMLLAACFRMQFVLLLRATSSQHLRIHVGLCLNMWTLCSHGAWRSTP